MCGLPYRNVSVQILPRTANEIRLDSLVAAFLQLEPATLALAGAAVFLAAKPARAYPRLVEWCWAAAEALRASPGSKATLNANRAGILHLQNGSCKTIAKLAWAFLATSCKSL